MEKIKELIPQFVQASNSDSIYKEIKHILLNKDFNKKELRSLHQSTFQHYYKTIDHFTNKDLIKLEELSKLFLESSLFKKPQSEVYFSPGDDCADAIITEIHSAERKIDLCVFTISDDRISQSILIALKKGIQIRIITDDEKIHDRGSDIFSFYHAGIPVKIDNSRHFMHDKFAIFDNQSIVTGSFNWTNSASKFNQENLILNRNKNVIQAYESEFNKLWESFNFLQTHN